MLSNGDDKSKLLALSAYPVVQTTVNGSVEATETAKELDGNDEAVNVTVELSCRY